MCVIAKKNASPAFICKGVDVTRVRACYAVILRLEWSSSVLTDYANEDCINFEHERCF